MKKKIVVASDHGGYKLKEDLKKYLKKIGYQIKDFGPHSKKRVNYIEYAAKLSMAVAENEFSVGILICKSGVGMSIAANRFIGIRASVCYNKEIAQHTRKHNLSNVLCLGAHFLNSKKAQEIVKTWLETKPGKKKRYLERAEMLDVLGMPRCNGCC